MNIRSQLLREHSKANALSIVDFVGTDELRFGELLSLFLSDEYRVTQRAAHPLGLLFDRHPHLVQANIGTIIENLKNDVHVAVKRNTVRMLQSMPIPEEYEGFVMQTCFDYLNSRDEPVAVKVFSMTILANLAVKYPDIKNELALIIEELMEFGTAGILSRGRKILKQLK